MKHNLENIPEVSIDKVDAFYVTGTQHRDAAGKTNNLKLNLKNSASSGSLIDTISKMSGAERKALKAALDAPDANGHEYVDLGLPSGTLWATKYVGQDEQHPTGAAFTWGDLVAIADPDNYDYHTYKYWNNDNTGFTKYNATDGKTTLDLEDDAAHVNMGGDWHMPSADQLQELSDYCDVSADVGNNLVIFTSKVNANTLIVPLHTNEGGGEWYEIWSRDIDNRYENFPTDCATEIYGSVQNSETYIDIDYVDRYSPLNVLGVLGNGNQDSDSSDKDCGCVPTIEVSYTESSFTPEVTLAEVWINGNTKMKDIEDELGKTFWGIMHGEFPAIKVYVPSGGSYPSHTFILTKDMSSNTGYPQYKLSGTALYAEKCGVYCNYVDTFHGSGYLLIRAHFVFASTS